MATSTTINSNNNNHLIVPSTYLMMGHGRKSNTLRMSPKIHITKLKNLCILFMVRRIEERGRQSMTLSKCDRASTMSTSMGARYSQPSYYRGSYGQQVCDNNWSFFSNRIDLMIKNNKSMAIAKVSVCSNLPTLDATLILASRGSLDVLLMTLSINYYYINH